MTRDSVMSLKMKIYNNKEGKTNDGSRKDYCQEEESRIY